MRVFIAALLPQEIKLRVGEYIEGLKPNIDGVKWEQCEKLHVTLKFLGAIQESTAAQILDITQNLTLKYSPFKMHITRFGGFPGLETPRVLYIGLSPNEELSLLKSDIEQELELLGFEMETRRFTPHITVGRVKKRFGINSQIPILEKVDFEINQVGVIKSELDPKGSVYTPLKVFELSD